MVASDVSHGIEQERCFGQSNPSGVRLHSENRVVSLCHRIRKAMEAVNPSQLGGEGKIVEADETYFGNIPEANRPKFTKSGRPVSKNPGGPKNKRAIISLVERGGNVRSFHPATAHGDDIAKIARDNIARVVLIAYRREQALSPRGKRVCGSRNCVSLYL